jgi:hypothetical protein
MKMEKTIKCVLLDVDNVLITEVVEIMADVGEPNCKLVNPYQFFSIEDMKPWPKSSSQKEVLISSDKILTIADPTPEVIGKYLELTS